MEAFSIPRDRPLISFRFCREITVTRTKLLPRPAKFFGLAFFFLLPRFFRSRKLSRKKITSIRVVISFFTAVRVYRSSTKCTSKLYGGCVFGKVKQNERESKQFKEDDVTDQWFVIVRLHIFEWQHRNSTRHLWRAILPKTMHLLPDCLAPESHLPPLFASLKILSYRISRVISFFMKIDSRPRKFAY